jgi:hypothetical protein
MPLLRSQHPARKRSPHSAAPVEHKHEQSQAERHPWLKEVRSKPWKLAEIERRHRREERHRVRAQKHEALVNPADLTEYLAWKREQQIEAERARAIAARERTIAAGRHHVRRRSAEYYVTWAARFTRYVQRRLRRGKRLSRRTVSAVMRVGQVAATI